MKPESVALLAKYCPDQKLLKTENNEVVFIASDDFSRANYKKAEDGDDLLEFLKNHPCGTYRIVPIKRVCVFIEEEGLIKDEDDEDYFDDNYEDFMNIYFVLPESDDDDFDEYALIVKDQNHE